VIKIATRKSFRNFRQPVFVLFSFSSLLGPHLSMPTRNPWELSPSSPCKQGHAKGGVFFFFLSLFPGPLTEFVLLLFPNTLSETRDAIACSWSREVSPPFLFFFSSISPISEAEEEQPSISFPFRRRPCARSTTPPQAPFLFFLFFPRVSSGAKLDSRV